MHVLLSIAYYFDQYILRFEVNMDDAIISEKPQGNDDLKKEEEFGLIADKQGFRHQVPINRGLRYKLDKDILLVLLLLAEVVSGEE